MKFRLVVESFAGICLALLVAGCTTHKGFVDYKEFGVYAHGAAGNAKFRDVGPVSASHSSFIWSTCDSVAQTAIRDLLDLARTRGANTVYNIKFEGPDGQVTTPTCYRRWGWFVIYIIGGLGPWMTATSVEGIGAELVDGVAPKEGASIYIPDGANHSELAREFVARQGSNLEER